MSRNFNEVLKEREKLETKTDKEMSLDSTERIKVLSPGQLVFKRFIRNKLAIVGTVILVAMFTFSFLIPIFYGYGQTEIFYKYDNSIVDYAQAVKRTEFSAMYLIDESTLHYTVKNKLTATINSMISSGKTEEYLSDSEGNSYKMVKNEDNIYTFYASDKELVAFESSSVKVGTYAIVGSAFTPEDGASVPDGIDAAIKKAVEAKEKNFVFEGSEYTLKQSKKTYAVSKESDGLQYVSKSLGDDFEAALSKVEGSGNFDFGGAKYSVSVADGEKNVYKILGENEIAVLTTYVFDSYEAGKNFSDEFKLGAIEAMVKGGDFEADGATYTVKKLEDESVVYDKSNEEAPVCALSNFVIRRYNGEDTLEYAFKETVRETIDNMLETKTKVGTFKWDIAQVDSEGSYTYDENGMLIKEERELTITDKNGSYVLTVPQVVYLIDTFNKPSKEHVVGTDGDGMDVLARMMYGGRVSLLVAFIVVIIENILGIIMGGIAGFYGGWIDNLIMRMVDIFYCIPSMPILIILGSMFDAMKMKPYTRVAWLMVVLGVLGWAGVARLVRGQILSLREQEFMVATEALGLKTKRKIFKHLIPNVMPQLIVTATSGLGGVILTESTLSFLGLGVKHPLATWGTMINSVSTAEAMKAYTYIWVPVGLLICLTVVAFNFVGDGLRDAFDPKMKR